MVIPVWISMLIEWTKNLSVTEFVEVQGRQNYLLANPMLGSGTSSLKQIGANFF